MSSWTAQVRKLQAEQRRQERDARKRQKDLERRSKEKAKLSALEQARLEVEAHENALEVLLSVHKEQSAPIDWAEFASALPPHEPVRPGRLEFEAVLRHGVGDLENSGGSGGAAAEEARARDEREYQTMREEYERERAEWERMRALAKRVLSGEAGAYSEAISEFSSLGEIAHLGSSIHFTVRSPKLIDCVLTVSGREAIPAEVKSLTAAGKLSVKTMPKPRFHEIYQDYVCGCVLRLAREVLALLPVDEVLVTASVDGIDARSGRPAELPVLSAAIARDVVERLDFERLDPSDSMENFPHRGDVMASRKGGEFLPIVPLTPADLAPAQPERMDFAGLLTNVRQLRVEIGSKLKPVTPIPDENAERSLTT
ncbi:MAG: hypothetical protein K8R23_00035 [Chthoniobacter sp.]|nr:hypothetical protein [Chthoniobacter sp.]